jgi:hypothetical protein
VEAMVVDVWVVELEKSAQNIPLAEEWKRKN